MNINSVFAQEHGKNHADKNNDDSHFFSSGLVSEIIPQVANTTNNIATMQAYEVLLSVDLQAYAPKNEHNARHSVK